MWAQKYVMGSHKKYYIKKESVNKLKNKEISKIEEANY